MSPRCISVLAIIFILNRVSAQANDVLFAVCGDPVEEDVEEVHLVNVGWNCSKPANYPHNVNGPTGGLINNQEVIVCGGFDNVDFDYSRKCFNYSLGTDQWNVGPNMTEKRLRAMSVSLDSSRWWVTGGTGDNGAMNSTEIYENGQFRQGPPLPMALFSHCLVQVNATTTFVGGGYDVNSVPQKKAWLFNWQTQSWTPLRDMFQNRAGPACGMIDKESTPKIVVAGGNFFVDIDTVEFLNLETGYWSFGTSLPIEITDATLIDTGNKLVLAGGYSPSGGWVRTMYELSAGGNSWRPMEQSLKNGRSRFVGLAIPESLSTCVAPVQQ